jgi:hypothetical protein
MIVATLGACGANPDTAPAVAAAIVITSPSGAIPIDGTMQFVATVTDASGNTIATTPTWTLVNGGGAITTAGMFTAGDSIGTFTNTIVATIGSVTSTSSVTVSVGELASIAVSPVSDTLTTSATQQFTAIGHDAHGHVVVIPSRVWSASSAAGTIDTSGMFTAATTAGVFAGAVTATSGTISGTSAVVVTPGPLATIVVSPATATLDQGATQQFTAVGKDAHNNTVVITPTWAATLGGTIDAGGLFTAGPTAGTFTDAVSATSGSISGTSTVTVNPGPLATIAVSPPNVFIFPSGSTQFTAVGKDAGGNVVPIAPVWSVTTSGIGTISQTGLLSVSSTASGTYPNTIVATSGSISGSASALVFFIPCIPICGPPGLP